MVQIHGFLGSSDLELLPCAPLPFRRIEVYGDSVSAGEVSEAVDYCGQPDPVHNGEYSNSYYSYAWLTARKLGARLHDIAQGGIALTDGIGYFMEPEQKGMESIFDKIQYQPQLLGQFPEELGRGGDLQRPLEWDFSQYRPQVVILAVGQNDAHPNDFCGEDYEGEQAAVWRERYGAMVRRLRRAGGQESASFSVQQQRQGNPGTYPQTGGGENGGRVVRLHRGFGGGYLEGYGETGGRFCPGGEGGGVDHRISGGFHHPGQSGFPAGELLCVSGLPVVAGAVSGGGIYLCQCGNRRHYFPLRRGQGGGGPAVCQAGCGVCGVQCK